MPLKHAIALTLHDKTKATRKAHYIVLTLTRKKAPARKARYSIDPDKEKASCPESTL